MTARELELENLELRLEIGLLKKEKFDLLHEIYDIRREAGLKDPKEYHYKSRKQELKEFLASKLDSRIVYFNISIRALNVLKSINCDTLRDVSSLVPKKYLRRVIVERRRSLRLSNYQKNDSLTSYFQRILGVILRIFCIFLA